jgi:hypothetical protein
MRLGLRRPVHLRNMRAHFTVCPKWPTSSEHGDRRRRYSKAKRGRPPGQRMLCGWLRGARITASRMRTHFSWAADSWPNLVYGIGGAVNGAHAVLSEFGNEARGNRSRAENARTLSGVTRRTGAVEWRGTPIAGSLRIGTFEGSRPRLRRMRQVWVLNHPGYLWRGFADAGEGADWALPREQRQRNDQFGPAEWGFSQRIGALDDVGAHLRDACRSKRVVRR